MRSKKLALEEIKPNPNNPRFIKDKKYDKLLNSLREFPEMMDIRPIVVNKDHVVLGGNMRLRACIELGWEKVPVIIANLSPAQEKEFVIKDNASFGEWDYEDLLKNWNVESLDDWGVDLPDFDPEDYDDDHDSAYTAKVETPTYEPKEEKPDLSELVDVSKMEELCAEIQAADIPEDIREFLILAAHRHNVFTYSKIADYYAQAPREVQHLMERSALVLIDFHQAIEGGFVRMTENLKRLVHASKSVPHEK